MQGVFGGCLKAVPGSDNRTLAGKIVSVTPQQSHESPASRGFRVDVEVMTDRSERVLIEVELHAEKAVLHRNLSLSSRIFHEASSKGDTVSGMASKLPKVIHINLMDFVLRKGSVELVEPFKVMYTKKPFEVALPNFGGYNIQLPNVAKRKADLTDGLYAWCFTLYKAHREKMTIREVLDMHPELQEYARSDKGFEQLSARHTFVTNDPAARARHESWWQEYMKIRGQIESAYVDGTEKGIAIGTERGMAQGIAIGTEQGIAQGILQVAASLLSHGMQPDKVAKITGLSEKELITVRVQVAE